MKHHEALFEPLMSAAPQVFVMPPCFNVPLHVIFWG